MRANKQTDSADFFQQNKELILHLQELLVAAQSTIENIIRGSEDENNITAARELLATYNKAQEAIKTIIGEKYNPPSATKLPDITKSRWAAAQEYAPSPESTPEEKIKTLKQLFSIVNADNFAIQNLKQQSEKYNSLITVLLETLQQANNATLRQHEKLINDCKNYLLENFINPLTNDPGIIADDAKKSYRHLYGRQFDNWLHRIQQIQDIISEKLSQPAPSRPHAHKPAPAQPQTHDSKATVSRKAEEIIKWLDADFIENNFLSDAGWRKYRTIHGTETFKRGISDFISKLENALEAAEQDEDRGFLDRNRAKLNECKACLEKINNILQQPKENLYKTYNIDIDNPRSSTQTWASSIASISAKIAEKPSARPPTREGRRRP